MHIIFGQKKHLMQQPLIYKKEVFNGFLLIRSDELSFEAHYYSKGYRQSQLPGILAGLNLDFMVNENDLEFNDIGDPYFKGGPFSGSSFLELNNRIVELSTYSGSEMPLHVVYDSAGSIQHLEKTHDDLSLEVDFSEGCLSKLIVSNSDLNFDLCLLYKDGNIGEVIFRGIFDKKIFGSVENAFGDLIGDKFDVFSVGKDISLSFGSVVPDIIDLLKEHNINTLTLYKTRLTVDEVLSLAKDVKPLILEIEEDAVLQDEFDKAASALSQLSNMSVVFSQ